MFSLFSLFLIVDFVLIAVLGSVNTIVMVITTIIWTYFVYAVLVVKGISFKNDDPLVEKCGRIFYSTKGTFEGTIIASINMIILAMIVNETSLKAIEELAGPFSSIMIFAILPLPSFVLISLKSNEQKDLYEHIYRVMTDRSSQPEFLEQTMSLITIKDRFSEEYTLQLEKVRKSTFEFIQRDLNDLSSFFMPDKSFHFNLEYLAIFLTKRITGLPD
ncbi:MAG: hypothetical protein ACTSR2_15345 [Candidatus Hodarchaeales archaeon]